MESVSLPALGRVAVCGGTHGNELSGVYLVRELQRKQREDGDLAWPIAVETVISNPRAVEECRRYTQTDLNRCFTSAILSSPVSDSTPYEVRRAQELNSLLGPKGSPEAVDLLCDLHNTTSNMGLTLISCSLSDWICLHIFKHLQTSVTTVPVWIYVMDLPISEAYSLDTVGKHGFAIEVGPQPHGVIRADVFNSMKEAVRLALEWVQRFNSGAVVEGGEVEVYTFVKSVDYPRDPETRQITAAIHPELQDRDFSLLRPGDPLFLSFTGQTVRYEGEESLHPFFINECAYYEKGIAFHLARKKTLKLPSVQVKAEEEREQE